MVRILIVEDELIISQDMSNMLTKMGYYVVGDAIDFDEAITLLNTEIPDLILLDVNLNGKKDGIDLAEEINNSYKVPFIFTTSYSDKSTLERAKKTNPINYLVKPFKSEQLFTAIEIALHKLAAKDKDDEWDQQSDALMIKDAIFVKDKFKYSKIVISEIMWIRSEGNYLEIHTDKGFELVRASMTYFLERLDQRSFFRTHKSYIVNLNHMTKLESTNITIGGTIIPVSKTYIDDLMKRLNII
ncbi:response regulator [Flavobacterium sp.]|uniref:LytR/AlgR family response regulator transcription factor n=1 Tax=Flavobacterium sp. TaxID=239 RepID=UPI00260686FA|nr:response regulator [Flavobacterium sp.]